MNGFGKMRKAAKMTQQAKPESIQTDQPIPWPGGFAIAA